jgi:hypothetical protein
MKILVSVCVAVALCLVTSEVEGGKVVTTDRKFYKRIILRGKSCPCFQLLASLRRTALRSLTANGVIIGRHTMPTATPVNAVTNHARWAPMICFRLNLQFSSQGRWCPEWSKCVNDRLICNNYQCDWVGNCISGIRKPSILFACVSDRSLSFCRCVWFGREGLVILAFHNVWASARKFPNLCRINFIQAIFLLYSVFDRNWTNATI